MSLEQLEELEQERDQRGDNSKQLTFDCLHAKVNGNRVFCEKGYPLGTARDGTTDLVSVLRGITSAPCKDCAEFEGMDNV